MMEFVELKLLAFWLKWENFVEALNDRCGKHFLSDQLKKLLMLKLDKAAV